MQENTEQTNPSHYRAIKSFVLRQSRLTNAQENALKKYSQHYIYPFSSPDVASHLQNRPLDLPTESKDIQPNLFLANHNSDAVKIIEIGFGNGDSLITECLKNPQTLFFGIEVHLPGIARLIHRTHQANISNLQIIRADAQQAMQSLFPSQFFDQIRIFFPDPWHKKRHHKRRLLNQPFIEKTIRSLKNDGILHIATDWQDYADHIQHTIAQIPNLTSAPKDICEKLIAKRPKTAYEKRGISLNHQIHELIYRKNTQTA